MASGPIVYQGETFRIWYRAQGGQTGLTDCVSTVLGPTGTVIANAAAMTESSNGFYYYDVTSTNTLGDYTHYCNSETAPRVETGGFRVITAIRNKVSGGGLFRSGPPGADQTELIELVKELKRLLISIQNSKSFEKKVDTSVAELKKEFSKMVDFMKEIEDKNKIRDKIILGNADPEDLAMVLDSEDE